MTGKVYTLILSILLSLGTLFSAGKSQSHKWNGLSSSVSFSVHQGIPNQTFSSPIDDTTHDLSLDLQNLKTRLDSFVEAEKNSKVPLALETDTINATSTYEELWAFNKGLFEIINQDRTDLLVRHYFYEPDTKRMLRLYLLELHFDTVEKSTSFFRKLESRKSYKADLTDEVYLEYGLTGTTDYLIYYGRSIFWLNASCLYSKKEFDQLIGILEDSSKPPKNAETIKCYCHEACE